MTEINDNSLFFVRQKDEKTGLTGMFGPPFFYGEAAELGITGQLYIARFSCAWYFCGLAHRTMETMAEQVVFEDETDETSQLRNILDSVLQLYGGAEVNEVMHYMPECRKLAFRRKLLWSSRFQAWLDSAGRAYNEMTREEKAINKDS